MRLEGQNTRVMRTPLARPARRRRFRGDDGAIMAEAALITPFFILIIFGIVEFGGAFRDYQTVSNGASQGTRTAAIQGNATGADWSILQAVIKGTRAVPSNQIVRIVVFHASSTNRTVPAVCKTGSTGSTVSGSECNVYTGANLATAIAGGIAPIAWANASPPSGSNPIAYYRSDTRKVHRDAATGGPRDYVGVYVEVLHPWVTGLFGKNITLSDTSVTQLEPQKV